MTAPTLNQLVHGIGGSNVTGFFLVLARVSPLFLFAPIFSSRMIPTRVKGIAAVGISIGMTGIAMHGQRLPGTPPAVAGLMLKELLVGLAFAFAMGAVLAAVEAAGALIDAVAGFSFGSLIDPINGNAGGSMTQLHALIGLMIFIAIGGDAWMLRGLARTFDLVPLARGPQLRTLVGGAVQAFSSILVSAIEVAAPALLALLITDVAFGMVSRVVPQLNVFAVGLPMKVGVSLLVVAAALPFLGGWMSDQLAASVGTALSSLRIG